jgi:hypothetical protein
LTFWESMMPAVGSPARPWAARARRRGTARICPVALSFSQRVTYQETVCQGGKSKGNCRHAQPVRTTGGGGSGAGEAVGVGAGLDDVAAEGLVGGDRDGVLLLAFGEDLEQQFGAAAVEGQVCSGI